MRAITLSAITLLFAAATVRAGEAFRFSVLGDNRPREARDPVTPPAEFRQAIREVNLLKPDFAVIVGDLIMGYTTDEELLVREWGAFEDALGEFRVPVWLTTGNHDAWSEPARALWKERHGDLAYAFDHKGCRFVMLDSEEPAHKLAIGGAQLTWLGETLAKPGAVRTFVFLHAPLWRNAGATAAWERDVQPLLTAAKVEAVFAGHEHVYERSADRGGVRYYVCGGAGAEVGECEYAGDFFHHLLVDVPADAKEPAGVHVLKTGFLAPDDIVTEAERDRCEGLAHELHLTGLTVVEGRAADLTATLSAENPWDVPVVVRHSLVPEASGAWKMEPVESAVTLSPGAPGTIRLRFTAPAGELLPGPTVRVVASRGATEVVRYTARVSVRFDRTLGVSPVPSPVTVDGKLDESAWAAVAPAGAFFRTDGGGPAARATELRVARDGDALVLALRCERPGADTLAAGVSDRDWSALGEDCVVFYLDTARDGKSRYCLGVTALGVPMDYAAPGGAPDFSWNPDWAFAVTRDAAGFTVEARIPLTAIGLEAGAGGEFGFNVVRMDRGEGQGLSAWSMPVAGSLTNPAGYGSAVLAPSRPSESQR